MDEGGKEITTLGERERERGGGSRKLLFVSIKMTMMLGKFQNQYERKNTSCKIVSVSANSVLVHSGTKHNFRVGKS